MLKGIIWKKLRYLKISNISAQLCCESNTAPKNKVYFKKINNMSLNLSNRISQKKYGGQCFKGKSNKTM